MGYSSLHDAVMDASVSHAMNQMSTGDVDVAATNAGYVGSAPVSAEEGYDQLRDSIDDSIAALVATKEQVNMAESTNDPSLLKAASASLTATLDNSTSFWEVQVRPKAVYSVVHEKRVRMKRSGANATNAISAPLRRVSDDDTGPDRRHTPKLPNSNRRKATAPCPCLTSASSRTRARASASPI